MNCVVLGLCISSSQTFCCVCRYMVNDLIQKQYRLVLDWSQRRISFSKIMAFGYCLPPGPLSSKFGIFNNASAFNMGQCTLEVVLAADVLIGSFRGSWVHVFIITQQSCITKCTL